MAFSIPSSFASVSPARHSFADSRRICNVSQRRSHRQLANCDVESRRSFSIIASESFSVGDPNKFRELSIVERLGLALMNGVFSIKPLGAAIKKVARNTIVKRAEKLGVPWRAHVQELQTNYDLDTLKRCVEDPSLDYPPYYFREFHTYPQGNLGWEAALEVEVSAVAVHSPLFPDAPPQEGDRRLRSSYTDVLRKELPVTPRDVVDLGCSTGLSSFAMQDAFPDSRITGVDLSPNFLAIAKLRVEQRKSSIALVHAAAEATTLPSASFDLVSLSLVAHELPQDATRSVLREGLRLLRPGGHMAIMDQNPFSEAVRRLPPLIFALFKTTEPYLDEYLTLDLESAMLDAGYEGPTVRYNSPRHRTIIARKPL